MEGLANLLVGVAIALVSSSVDFTALLRSLSLLYHLRCHSFGLIPLTCVKTELV